MSSQPPVSGPVLGIDPGSRYTGYGIIDEGADGAFRHVASGVIQVEGRPFPDRLRTIFEELGAIIERYRPALAAVEQVFVRRNPDSALKLGQARGAAICACVGGHIEIAEYTASAVKQAITGSGGAEKTQVAYMVRMLLSVKTPLQEDAADALAVALCHVHRQRLERRIAGRGWA